MTLACMSGNVGIQGGGFAGRGNRINIVPIDSLPRGPHKPVGRVSSAAWASNILEDDLDPPIKMAYIVAANLINRTPDTLRNIQALKQLDFIVVQDPYLTPTARFADIVLPICTDLERTDLVVSWGHDSHLFYSQQSVDKLGESRTDYWVFSNLAKRLGIHEAYTQGRSEEEWISHLLGSSELDVGVLKREGIIRLDGEPRVALAEFRADPKANPLNTSSGLIEIVCPEAVKAGLPSVPSYIGTCEDSEQYPLQLLTPHSRIRSHSCLHTNPWLQRLEPHSVWINSKDAKVRGVQDGEVVEVTSKSGTIRIPAMVTERIMPGVVCVYQGTWYQPSSDDVDEGGCTNVLTTHRTTKTGGYATHSDRVEVVRASK
jgi:anaerobic dimethyl sulfoxide reductase subunit A